MAAIEIVSGSAPEISDQIDRLLVDHAREHGIVWDEQALIIVLREGGAIVGGLSGKTVQGWLHIRDLAIDPDWRGKGFGRRLVAEAERIAIGRGCHSAWLNTHSFQAPGFYERLDYTPFGVLEDFPRGQQRIFYAKQLVPQ